jgi:hypothetical protein
MDLARSSQEVNGINEQMGGSVTVDVIWIHRQMWNLSGESLFCPHQFAVTSTSYQVESNITKFLSTEKKKNDNEYAITYEQRRQNNLIRKCEKREKQDGGRNG